MILRLFGRQGRRSIPVGLSKWSTASSVTRAPRTWTPPSARRQFHVSRPCNRHDVPILEHQDQIVRNGVPGLLSPEGFDFAWTKYQSLIVHKLNEYTVGTPFEGATAQATVLQSARQPETAALFNYASMAYNNHFFFQKLNTVNPDPIPIPHNLREIINDSFSSVESLRAAMIAAADAMFGPGFVWLVQVSNLADDRSSSIRGGNLRILSTYNAGSPLSGAHYRRQPVDMNTYAVPGSGNLSNEEFVRQNAIQNTVGSMGRYASKQGGPLAPGGADITPLLCVNTWEHVWLRDWDMHGKVDYLAAWWERVNWEAVAQDLKMSGRSNVYDRRAPERQFLSH